MGYLRQGDAEKLLSAVNNLYSDVDPSNLKTRLMTAVKTVIAGEIIAFDIFNAAGVYQEMMICDPANALTNEDLQLFAEYAIEHPFFADIFLS